MVTILIFAHGLFQGRQGDSRFPIYFQGELGWVVTLAAVIAVSAPEMIIKIAVIKLPGAICT